MMRTHKIRLNPTLEQEIYFRKAVGTARFVFNWGLNRWKEAKAQGVKAYGVMALKKEFNGLKAERFPWVYDVTKSVCESALMNLGKALKNYFDSKRGKRKGEKNRLSQVQEQEAQQASFWLGEWPFSGGWE